MTPRPANPVRTARNRELRQRQTKAESLIWTVLRAKRLAGLKFRRQHPLGPYIVDFACIEKDIVIELDGGYHEHQYDKDRVRQAFLESQGWQVLRFSNEDVLLDVEALAISIAGRAESPLFSKGGPCFDPKSLLPLPLSPSPKTIREHVGANGTSIARMVFGEGGQNQTVISRTMLNIRTRDFCAYALASGGGCLRCR